MTDHADLLARLERYYDDAPRAGADTEEHGPFTVFVSRGGWPYYARPRLGHTGEITADDVSSVLDRLEELGVPRSIEWVHDTTPSLRAAARAAGVEVGDYPLLVLASEPVHRRSPATVRRLAGDDPELASVQAAVHVGFGQDDTRTGPASVAERDALVAEQQTEHVAHLLASGRSVLYGAFDPELGAVGGGSHNPRGDVTEIVGVGVLPAYRRRGLAAAITARLARHALDNGVRTVFCSAQDDAVAHVYESVGFRRVGTACVAEAE